MSLETITIAGELYRQIESPSGTCDGCALRNGEMYEHCSSAECTPASGRTDGRYVIFTRTLYEE